MDIKIIVALVSLVGIALGALTSGLGYFYKVRAERLKTTKETLYYLLEFRAHFKASSFSPKDLSAEYLSICNDFFKKKKIPKEALPQGLTQLLDQMFSSVIETMAPNISADFLTAYEKSLKSLANDNPVLAYRLRGKEAYAGIFALMNEYYQQLKTIKEFNDEDIPQDFVESQIVKMNDWGFTEQLEQTDKDISLVAKRCDFATRWEVRKILANKKKPVYSLRDFDIEDKLELLLENLMEFHTDNQAKAL